MSDAEDKNSTPPWEPADLRDHPKVKSAMAQLDHPKFQVDESVVDEVQALVSVAKERKAHADKIRLPNNYQTKDEVHKLAQYLAEAQAFRDRAIEIKIGHLPQRRSLQILWEKCEGFLYRFEEIRKCSPAPARDAAIKYVLAPLRDAMTKVDMIIEAASEADRNLGNVYFTLKELKGIGMAYLEAAKVEKGH